LILARASAFRLVLSPYVEVEVERALLAKLAGNHEEGSRLIDDYALALNLLAPERTQRITQQEFDSYRSFIHHMNDVPVLVTAIKSKPDWLITSNIEHFNEQVARRTGLRIATPRQFLERCGVRS
jgi:hypothetical protein